MKKRMINDYEKEIFEVPTLGKVYVVKNTYGLRRPIQFLGYAKDKNRYYIFDCVDVFEGCYTEYLAVEVDLNDITDTFYNKTMTYEEFINMRTKEGRAYIVYIEYISTENEVSAIIEQLDEEVYIAVDDLIDERPIYFNLI